VSALRDAPGLHVAIASLHVALGHLGAGLIFRLRFGRSPLVLYGAPPSPHRTWSRILGGLAATWAALLIATAWSDDIAGLAALRPLLAVPAALAWTLALGGLVLMCTAQVLMGSAFRVGQDAHDGAPELRTTGLWARSRNPIYVGSWLAIAGMTLWHPSPALVAACLAIGLGMHRLVGAEEVFLRARFGARFDDYCRRTPRYVVSRW
jgi:protein-S-isoprenylcysteine O-methyltransferase Ste14